LFYLLLLFYYENCRRCRRFALFFIRSADDYYHAVYNNSYFCNMRGNFGDGIFLDILFLPIYGALFAR
jgi:hypothetical protein